MPSDPPRVNSCRVAMFSTSANEPHPRWQKFCTALIWEGGNFCMLRERERKLVATEEVESIEKSANTCSTLVHGEIVQPSKL